MEKLLRSDLQVLPFHLSLYYLELYCLCYLISWKRGNLPSHWTESKILERPAILRVYLVVRGVTAGKAEIFTSLEFIRLPAVNNRVQSYFDTSFFSLRSTRKISICDGPVANQDTPQS